MEPGLCRGCGCVWVFETLREIPRLLRQGPGDAADFFGLGACRRSLDGALRDPLEDRGDAEQAVDHIETPGRDCVAAGTAAIGGDIGGLIRNARGREVDPG